MLALLTGCGCLGVVPWVISMLDSPRDRTRANGQTNNLAKKRKRTDRTSRQTQAGIGHSAHAHRGGHMQNRIRRRQVRRGKIEHSSEAEQPRTDGGPGRQAGLHRRGWGLAGAHRSRHPKKARCNKIQTPQLHVPRGHTAQGSCRVEQERDNTSRGNNNGDVAGRKRRQ